MDWGGDRLDGSSTLASVVVVVVLLVVDDVVVDVVVDVDVVVVEEEDLVPKLLRKSASHPNFLPLMFSSCDSSGRLAPRIDGEAAGAIASLVVTPTSLPTLLPVSEEALEAYATRATDTRREEAARALLRRCCCC